MVIQLKTLYNNRYGDNDGRVISLSDRDHRSRNWLIISETEEVIIDFKLV